MGSRACEAAAGSRGGMHDFETCGPWLLWGGEADGEADWEADAGRQHEGRVCECLLLGYNPNNRFQP